MAPSLSRRRSTEPHQNPNNNDSILTTSTTLTHQKHTSSLSISPAFILLLFLTIWSISTLLSSSFHICVSSRKLDLYCISGRINQPGPTASSPPISNVVANGSKTETDSVVVNSSEEKIGNAYNNIADGLRQGTRNLVGSVYHNVVGGSKDEMVDAYDNVGGSKQEMAADLVADFGHHVVDGSKDEIDNAYHIVREQIQVIRSWASTSSNNTSASSCDGRGIFVYDLPPKFNKQLLTQCNDLLPWTDLCDYFDNEGKGQPIARLGKGWYRTHQYSLELIFHSRVLKHPCRVWNPDEARLFYVPFYGGFDILRWHFKNVSTDVKDALGIELVKWLEAQKSWSIDSGKDHMFVLGKISWDFRRRKEDKDSWGSNFLSLDQMQAPYKFLIERQPWEMNDIGIPHPTYFHPHNDGDIIAWQGRVSSSKRKSLVTFAGAARPGQTDNIRSILIKNCIESGNDCRFMDCISGGCSSPEDVVTAFTESEFCLQPPGDSPTRKSVFDSLVAGCIPVLFDPFTAYYQYPWHLPQNHTKYSVFIDKEEVREGKVNVIERLKSVSLEERKEMRRVIVFELMPGLVYGDSGSEFFKFRDAFGIVMDNMMDLVTKLG